MPNLKHLLDDLDEMGVEPEKQLQDTVASMLDIDKGRGLEG